MIPTRAVLDLVYKANSALMEAKYLLLKAEETALSIEENIYLVSVRKKVDLGIQEILRNFFPKTAFDEKMWLSRRRSTDAEHDATMEKILATGAFDNGVVITCKDE